MLTSPPCGRVDGILSIRGPEVSLEPLRVGTGHVQTPTPHAPPTPSGDTYKQFAWQSAAPQYKSPKLEIQSSLESTERGRMRSTGSSDLKPIPEGVRGPICIQKK